MHVLNYLGLAGMERGVVRLSNALPSEEFESVICVLRSVQDGVTRVVAPHVRVEVLAGPAEGMSAAIIWRLAKACRRIRPDIVHSHNFGAYVYTAMAKVANRRARFVHGEHGRDTPDWRLTRAERAFVGATKWTVDWFTTVARHLAIDLGRTWQVPVSRIVALQNGVELSRFNVTEERAAIRRSLGIPENAFVIGAVANFREVKDFETLFAAVSQLAERDSGLIVAVAGTHPSKEVASRFVEAGTRQCAPARPIFLGSRPDIERVIRAFDVYTNCSRYEGMSNTVLEAMASGCPVVASDVPGNREVLGDDLSEFLFPPGDHAALVDRILALRSDPRRRDRYVKQQSDRVRSVFSLQASIERYCEFYWKVTRHTAAERKCG